MSFVTQAKADELLALSAEAFDAVILDGADADALRLIGFGRVIVPAATYAEARAAAIAHVREQGGHVEGIYGAKHVPLTKGPGLWVVAYETR